MSSLISRHLQPEAVLLGLEAASATAVLQQVVARLGELAGLSPGQQRQLLQAVQERESQGSTVLGRGVAMPHAKSPVLKKYRMVAARTAAPLQDDVRLVFLMAGPPSCGGLHLQVMARLIRLCRHDAIRQNLLEAPTPEAFVNLLVGEETRAEQDER